MSVKNAASTVQNFMLQVELDGSLSLDRNHEYYAQVQGQLLVTGAKFCDFVLYTQVDIPIERITRDELFMTKLLSQMTNYFYKYHGKSNI